MPVTTYQHSDAQRKNIPPAGLATQMVLHDAPKLKLAYDPHLAPTLRFDETGEADRLTSEVEAILEKAKTEPLTPEETRILQESLLRSRQPWLEWAGKQEKRWFEVDPVALHIHERVSANAILKAAQREDIEHDLFADPQLSREEAMQFYKHDVEWANRLILGDSLQVMTSLSRREGLAGDVQMIYIDPPYGINYKSNWQNEIGRRDMGDSNSDLDLTREPEMIKAYRDTWTLGVHSYLDYLKQRLVMAHELLADTGSVFVQISDENLHRVRAVMDEVFGPENAVVTIVAQKKGSQKGELIQPINDFILWYAREKRDSRGALKVKFAPFYEVKTVAGDGDSDYDRTELPNGSELPISEGIDLDGAEPFVANPLTSGGIRANQSLPFEFNGRTFDPGKGNCWKTTARAEEGQNSGMDRLAMANRLWVGDKQIRFKAFQRDFGAKRLTNFWTGLGGPKDPVYVVQTNTKLVERCMLMTTSPGDLVLDPTCGSGTTAYVAEQWGRRWVTIDSSRVAVALARQRLLTAQYEAYKTNDPAEGVDPSEPKNPGAGFRYKTVSHVMLNSIANNKSLDSIFDKHEPVLKEKLAALNGEVGNADDALRETLASKLIAKHRSKGARAVTDADKRRWLLPGTDPQLIEPIKGGKGLKAITAKQAEAYRAVIPAPNTWQEWEVPFDTDPDWPQQLQDALFAYRKAWRAKMKDVNACIEANADKKELVDQPEVVKGVVRVTGPFTVESVRPLEDSLKGGAADAADSPIGGEPGEMVVFAAEDALPERDVTNAANHIERMVSLLRSDGLTFPNNKHIQFARLDLIDSEFLHAEGAYSGEGGAERSVGVVIGPEHGAVNSYQVQTATYSAVQRKFDELVFAAFSFDAAAQDRIHEANENPGTPLVVHLAQIRPDVLLGELLKGNKAKGKKAQTAQASQQIFTVFGQPRTRLEETNGEFKAFMDGVDVYDPVNNSVIATKAAKVAAWFLDSDYDGRTFCVCQAFFPDKGAWEKLAKALSDTIDPAAFAAFSGTKSLPFRAGQHKRAAIKVIDPRGNEVMRVHSLGDTTY